MFEIVLKLKIAEFTYFATIYIMKADRRQKIPTLAQSWPVKGSKYADKLYPPNFLMNSLTSISTIGIENDIISFLDWLLVKAVIPKRNWYNLN